MKPRTHKNSVEIKVRIDRELLGELGKAIGPCDRPAFVADVLNNALRLVLEGPKLRDGAERAGEAARGAEA